MKGTIKTKREEIASYDANGAPILSEPSFDKSYKCEYVSANRNDVYAVGDGTFTQASYIITIRDMNFNSKHIQLINSRDEIVCEKDVKSIEVLERIRRVKIVV